MFQNLRVNGNLYILYKDGTPRVDMAVVTNVSAPHPKYPMSIQFGQMQEMVVDVDAKIGEQSFSYKNLPAVGDIADSSEGVVVSMSRDAMNTEVMSLKQKSQDIISSVKYHEEIVNGCDAILKSINPEFAEKQAQQAEINNLKSQMGDMFKSLTEILTMLKGKSNSDSFNKK